MTKDAEAFDCFYRLDAADRILEWGGPCWVRFAEENEAPKLATRKFAGDCIYDHVAGHFTQRFLREFFAGARRTKAPAERTYRCDSQSAKRLMRMRATCDDGGCVRVEHRLIDEAPAAVAVAFRQAPGVRRAPYLRCSLCNRLRRTGADAWRQADEARSAPALLSVVHTVCQDCRDGLAAQLLLRPDRVA